MAVQFDVKDLGPCKWLLGTTIHRDEPNRNLTIHEGTYIRELLRRFGMGDCKPALMPKSTNDPSSSALLDDTMASQKA
jgi:hypothetical protein